MIQGYTKDGYQFTAGYDAENRLTTLNYNDGTQDHRVGYTYGANSFVRVIKKYVDEVLTEETRLVRDGYLIVQERDGSNTALRSYVWSSGALGGIGALTAMVQNNQVYYYLFDGRGNVASVVDDSANVVAGYVYDAFGELRTVTGSLEQPFRFSTKYYDGGTGMVDFGYRFYVAEIGRWLNRDPIGVDGGINLYGYVLSNPINFVDPYGDYYVPIIKIGVIIYKIYRRKPISFFFKLGLVVPILLKPTELNEGEEENCLPLHCRMFPILCEDDIDDKMDDCKKNCGNNVYCQMECDIKWIDDNSWVDADRL
ncbi:YD repeat protein [Candidatus Thiomargarita nelsonii]|uniref:YD repeat protein n=1 Tax=Candidatus Thiomargarita nelsonii TaxID=1003181 RepID=A0A0A6NZF5_9GAMM|nr:YD repeat protein [Candidatus Thiomargarita nelsonii]